MSEKAIDWGKPIQSVDGKPARVLCMDLKGDHPILVAVEQTSAEGLLRMHRDGRLYETDAAPAIRNVPEKFERVVWVNVYPVGLYGVATRECADANASPPRIARIRVPVTGHVGQFDE